MPMTLTSPAFANDRMIPKKHTCQGEDVSPELKWSDLPEGTQSLVLICEDPDAPMETWAHWIIFNIPPDEEGLPEGVPPEDEFENGARQGKNDFKKVGYRGPCPPGKSAHHYYFKLFALDRMLDLKARATKAELRKAIKKRVLAETEIMGKYQRE